jgi:hypothetical protein
MPRPRFTLRVALAVTAIVAVVAWQGGIAYKRRAALTRVRASANAIVITGNEATDLEMRLNPLRKIAGDQSIRQIIIRKETSGDEMDSLARLFPEARIIKSVPRTPTTSR